MPIEHISCQQLEAMLLETPDLPILDVRSKEEFTHIGHIPSAQLVPIRELAYSLGMLDPSKTIAVICQHGVRSLDACYFLESAGFTKLLNVVEGFCEWQGAFEREEIHSDKTSKKTA